MIEYNRDQVMKVISSVIDKVGANQSQPMSLIRHELQGLAAVIDQMHQDILSTRSHDVGGKHIPTATDELDAVVGATEEASATIMDSCEEIQAIVEKISDEDAKNAIVDQTNKIFEACSFQDITGQRINKVVKTLITIEDTVDNLLKLFGPVDKSSLPQAVDTRTEDEKLMEGPQMAGKGVSQDEIDKLLAEFD